MKPTIRNVTYKDKDANIIFLMFQEAKKHPHDGVWRHWRAEVVQAGNKFEIEADFCMRDAFLSYKNLSITKINRDRIILS